MIVWNPTSAVTRSGPTISTAASSIHDTDLNQPPFFVRDDLPRMIRVSMASSYVSTTAVDCQGIRQAQPHFMSCEVQFSRGVASIRPVFAAGTSCGVKSERLDRRRGAEKKLAREAAMPMGEAMLAEVRQANAAYLAGYERRLAAEIVAMLPDREEARRVLATVVAMLNVKLPPRAQRIPDAA
jgi:hypothetical protein